MLGNRQKDQEELFVVSSLQDLIPDDHILKSVDRRVDLTWIRQEVELLAV